MPKDTPSLQQQTASDPIGRDGWLTLLLSALLIILSGGLTLLWQGLVVWRHARQTPSTLTENIELVLIPGVRLENGQPNRDFQLRLQRSKTLHQHHHAQLLLLGGRTGSNPVSEAEAGRTLLLQEGVVAEAMLLEERSRNTLENLRNAREQLPFTPTGKIALVSNRYHLARCQALTAGLGMSPRLCAAEEYFSPTPRQWPRLLLEAFYLHWYHTGKIWSQLTRNHHSLARIS